MKEHIQTVRYQEVNIYELENEELEDLNNAAIARDQAVNEVTNYSVGAAIRTNDNQIFEGHNVEDPACLVLHAEVNALGNINIPGRESGIKRITVVGGSNGKISFTPPCGHCRQKLVDYLGQDDDPDVLIALTTSTYIRAKLRDLLPLVFAPSLPLQLDK